MDDQRLRKLLEQLHHEIDHTQDIDEKGKALLRETQKEINDLLERSESDSASLYSTSIHRLEKTIAHLEVSHPDLTTLLSELLNILSNAGI